tara:strand:- start:1513 stop:1896 length:384 start_codon:yes stop_codon:yes gene_type:complete
MSTPEITNNIKQLFSFGYDYTIAKRYLQLCNNNVDKTLEFLINTSSSTDSPEPLDTSKISDILYDTYIDDEDIDLTKYIEEKLLEYNKDIEVVKKILIESDGNYQHAKLLITTSDELPSIQTDSDSG